MNIWKVIANEGYNNAFLIDQNGKQCFDKSSDYMEINDSPPLRTLKIEVTEKANINKTEILLGGCKWIIR